MSFRLKKLEKEDILLFIKLNQEAFQKGYEDYFGKCEDTIIPEKDILQSLNTEGSHAYLAYEDDVIVGGVDVTINEKSQINELDLLFVKVDVQSKGIGFKIWSEIENLYPETKVWKTCTPYFDQRNIHFYVNKCKFHIVNYINKYHHDQSQNDDFIGDAGEGMFEFEKEMKK